MCLQFLKLVNASHGYIKKCGNIIIKVTEKMIRIENFQCKTNA